MRPRTRKIVRRTVLPPPSVLTARRCTVAEPGDYPSDAVKAVRTNLGLSQAVFAELLGVSKSLVEHWERGVRLPSLTVRRLLDALAQNPASLMSTVTTERAG